ncbi:MFS transporter [Aestuariivita sp.]|jgi:MFS family permease|uniref:MFS transporter n=1 Tax=Aestuariivita sp. TaxID=1872407 RepID=UPI002173438D|nr:MFS transporter [Aestuariivita sp.]MCE8006355.1 MFS transporter [Aestuariivita sp.]
MTSDLSSDDHISWSEFLGAVHVPSLLLVCLAVWLHAADSLMVATMLPSIVDEIGGAALVGWSIALYELGSIVTGAASALLVMRHGFRAPMTVAALIFGTGCLLSALSPTMPLMLSGRLLQGLGGGGLVAMGFVAVSVLFPPRYTARAMAAISALWGMSAFTGPLIGGLFVEFASWRWGFVFFGAQAFGLAIWILLRAPVGGRSADAGHAGFPALRLVLLLAAVLFVAIAGIDVQPFQTTLLILAGLAAFLLFLHQDSQASRDTRLLPAAPFDPRRPAGATLSMILALSVATIAITAFGPLMMTAIHGASALIVGYIVACSSIGWTVTALLVSSAPERRDPVLITAGIALVVLSIPAFLYAVPNGPLWLIAVCAFVEGGGFGMAWTFILRRTTALSPPEEAQRIAGALPTVQRFGYALGAAYIGIVANAAGFFEMSTPEEARDVAQVVFLACLPPALLALPGLWGLVRARPERLAYSHLQ